MEKKTLEKIKYQDHIPKLDSLSRKEKIAQIDKGDHWTHFQWTVWVLSDSLSICSFHWFSVDYTFYSFLGVEVAF